VLIENNANGAINLQQLRNNMYYHSSHGSRHFVHKPKSASKIRLVRWPALLEKPLANYMVRWPADRNRLASGLPITRMTHPRLHCLVTQACVCGRLAQGCTRKRGGRESNLQPADRKSSTPTTIRHSTTAVRKTNIPVFHRRSSYGRSAVESRRIVVLTTA